jgi:hypothetical protein
MFGSGNLIWWWRYKTFLYNKVHNIIGTCELIWKISMNKKFSKTFIK